MPSWGDDIMYASAAGQAYEVYKLIERGYDVNACDRHGTTALMRSLHNIEVVELLLHHGATPNTVRLNDNATALLLAVSSNNVNVVLLLLQYGADPNLCPSNGRTVLSYAIYHPVPMMSILVQHGADVKALNHKGENALSYAAGQGKRLAVEVLLQLGCPMCKDKDGRMPLAALIRAGVAFNCIPKVFKAQVNAQDHTYGRTALMHAADGSDATVRALLECGADPNVTDLAGQHALLIAARSIDALRRIKMLFGAGADVLRPNMYGITAATIAAQYDRVENLCLLFALGGKCLANDNYFSAKVNSFLNTALHMSRYELTVWQNTPAPPSIELYKGSSLAKLDKLARKHNTLYKWRRHVHSQAPSRIRKSIRALYFSCSRLGISLHCVDLIPGWLPYWGCLQTKADSDLI